MAPSTPYRLPEGLFYLDTAAAAQYEANVGAETVVAQKVNASPGQVLDAWVKFIWLAGATEVAPGQGRGYVNHTRFMDKMGVEEKILSAGVPSSSDASGAVASVMYMITKAGPLPIKDYLALVRFIAVGENQTEVVWTIKITPKVAGKNTMGPVVKKTIAGGLAAFAKGIDATQAKAKL